MANLRVGIVSECYFPTLGGIQEHVRHLRNYLLKTGVEVTVFAGHPSEGVAAVGPDDAELGVVRVGRSRAFRTGGTYTQATIGPLVLARLARHLQRGRFDLLNIHGPCDLGLATLAMLCYRGPKVFTLHSCFPDAKWRRRIAPFYRWVFRRASSVIAVSDATAQSMGRYADFHAHVIPNGIDVDYWNASPSAHYRRLGWRNIVYLGRLEERNGPDIVVDAFAKVAARVPDVRLFMAGEGPMRAQLEQRVPAALRNRVEFLGALYNERPDLLAASSVFLLPARAVGFSILVLEAFASGLPVVALPALGTDRAGDHWSNVLLAKNETPDAFADAVIQALQTDQSERIARGRQIAAAYDWKVVGDRILSVFQGVLPPDSSALVRQSDLAA